MKAHAVHASLPERMAFVEKLRGDSADKHTKEIEALKQAHSKHAKSLDEHHATVEQRIDYVEKMLGDSADKHAKELRALKAAHDKHASDVSELKGGLAVHATLPE